MLIARPFSTSETIPAAPAGSTLQDVICTPTGALFVSNAGPQSTVLYGITASDISSPGHVNVGTPQNRVSTVPVTAGMFGLGGLNGLTTILNVNGAGNTTITWAGATTSLNQTNFLAALNAITGLSASVVNGALVLSATSIVVGNGTANTLLGFTNAQSGASLTGSVAIVASAYADSTLHAKTIILTIGGVATTLTCAGGTTSASSSALVTAINSTFTITSYLNNSSQIVIPTAATLVVGAGTANTLLGLTAGSITGRSIADMVKDISPTFTPITNGTIPVCREVISAGGGTLTFAYPSQIAGGYTSTYILPAGQIVALQAAHIYTTSSGGPTDLIVRF